MKLAVPQANGGRRKIAPPVPLERPEHKDLERGEYQTYKLRNTPEDADSPTYELSIPYFTTGTCEEWLRFRKNLSKVLTGQNVTTGPPSYAVARRLLDGDALTVFNNEATSQGNESIPHFTACLDAVARTVFPQRAVQLQKRFMRRFLRKPSTLKTREYTARLMEMNLFIPQFPPATVGGATPTALPDDEIIDLLEFGVPNSWQRTMVLQDFDPVNHTVQEFVAFCERMERIEIAEGTSNPTQQPKADKKPSPKKGKSDREKRKRSSSKDDEGSPGDCRLHGENCGHSTHDCRTLVHQAKRMKQTYDAQHSSQKKTYRQKQEMHAMVAAAVETMMEKGKGGKRNKRKSKKEKEQELQNFENLSLSDSSSENSDADSDSEGEHSA